MTDLLSSWQRDAQTRGLAPISIKVYGKAIKAFLRYLDGRDPSKVDKALLRDYVDYRRGKKVKTETIRDNLTALANFYDYLVFEDYIEINPIGQIKKRYLTSYKADGEKVSKKLLTVEEATRLVNSAVDIRDRAMIIALLKTGIRSNELLSLEVGDIDFKEQSILLKPTKKRSNRLVFFDDEAAQILRQWLAIREDRNHRGSSRLWVTTWGEPLQYLGLFYAVRKAATRAGLDGFSPHGARHWFTTRLLRAGMRREYVAWLRGDKIKEAIDIYYHINKDDVKTAYLASIPRLEL